MDLDDNNLYVTLDFDLDFSNSHRLYLPERYPVALNRKDQLALDLWPDQFDLWINRVSFGRPRSITWPQVLNVVYHSIRQLSMGFNPRKDAIDGVFWNTLRAVDSANSAAQITRRMRLAHEEGLLPSGIWKFAYEENPYDDGFAQVVCGGYLPQKVSDITDIKRIPPALRTEMLDMLNSYIESFNK